MAIDSYIAQKMDAGWALRTPGNYQLSSNFNKTLSMGRLYEQ